MPAHSADITVIYDSALVRKAVGSALSGFFDFREVPLERYANGGLPEAVLSIFCANMGDKESAGLIKKAINICQGETLFVLPTHNSDGITNRPVAKAWSILDPAKRKALKSAVVSFEKCFDQVANGAPIPLEDITSSCQDIREAAAMGGLDDWIDALDDHHDYSFRHSMFVCGSLTYFAHAMGIRGAELYGLTLGGLLHDIGKCHIPLEILDKPGKLDAREWDAMKLHPVYSRDILCHENDLSADIVAMAAYHHEKLDGTGYPDGLSGAQINDHIRLTAIADVYSALIDTRAYKGSMSSEAALDIMATMKDELDMDLVREFRSFTLDKG
jgi:HD-GYP domain-containing protein (c-di-GMP phosphodiesterase class II)